MLVIFGARLWLIDAFGSDVPFWDQWDAEAAYLYIPYFNGELSWQLLFQTHNEHRIVLTRLIALALLLVNGQWDAQLQMVVNAFFYSCIGVLVFWLMMPSKSWCNFWWVAVAIVFSLPFGWENTLGGFQLQFYLMIGFSLAIIWLLPQSKCFSKKGIIGLLCAGLSLFTMASGFFASLVVAVLIAIEFIKNKGKQIRRFDMQMGVVCVLITCAGIALKGTVPAHEVLKAHSVWMFVQSLFSNLSWPVPIVTVWGSMQWLPYVFLVGLYWQDREPSRQLTFVVGLGLLVLLQAVGAAYLRGEGALWPSSRYQDFFAMGILVNLYAINKLNSAAFLQNRRQLFFCFCGVWLFANSSALALYTKINLLIDLPYKKSYQLEGRKNLSAYLKTNNIDNLTGKALMDLPAPEPLRLRSLVDSPEILHRLPPSLKPDNSPGRLRNISQRLLRANLFVLILGVALFSFGLFLQRNASFFRSDRRR